ncbi:MAG: hypothetical protein LBE08_11705 [Bifidobacteriaceae bacterium]|jgi:hypothetical protein|nr:hypothetical protein [Bifidobacteriaceae bacterium]
MKGAAVDGWVTIAAAAEDWGLTAAIIVFGIGAALLAVAGIVFRVRAIANRKAWDGATVPLAVIGLIVTLVGVVAIYFTYKPAP